METFIALLKTMLHSGISPIATGIQKTAEGPNDREMSIAFRPGDQASIDDVFAELERLGLKPRRSHDGLTLGAGVNDI